VRLSLSVLLVASLVALALGAGGVPPDRAENAKRIAEIEKEIADLETKLARLRAELVKLQPEVQLLPAPREQVFVGGNIVNLHQVKDEVTGFTLPDIIIYLRDDTQITFSDQTKASAADLKVGQMVGARVDRGVFAQKGDPPIAFAHAVVIQKPKGGPSSTAREP
jgi:hypothetical protein